MQTRRFVLAATSILWIGAVPCAGEIEADDIAFFEKKIRPALIKHCYECHSDEAEKRKGGLWLDRRAGWQEGGDSGPAAVAHDVEGSLLIRTVRYGDPDLEMPPDGKLPADVVADFEEWVRRGLPDPRDDPGSRPADGGIDLEAGREFWSFQPRKSDFGEEASIDGFIDEALAENNLEAAPEASPAARLRRAKIDLTGLVPTVAEQDEFLEEPTEGKWEELVDRWLASDAFGERWGRHWLDLARYADSSGGGRAMPFPDAWRFRDFVIDSFREDRPLDELIVRHVAGDLLPYEDLGERQDNLIATGFLLLGPNNYENQNKAELELEIVDEQLDTMGRSFLGQTIGCARCHDHKFDPISAADYYAMAGIFLSTDFITHANVSKWHTEPVPPTPEAKAAIARYEEEKAAAEREVERLKKRIAELGGDPGNGKGGVAAKSLPGQIVDNGDAVLEGEWKESTFSGRWVGDAYIHDMNEGRVPKSVRFECEIAASGRHELRLSYSEGPNRHTTVPVTVETRAGTKEATVNQRLEPEHDGLFQTLGTFELVEGETVVVTVSNQAEASGHVIADAVQWLPLFAENESGDEEGASDALTNRLGEDLRKAEKALKKIESDAPPIPEAMAVVDRAPDAVADTEIRIRGVESNRGEKVPRGFLQVASWETPDLPKDSSGRLELARWLVDSRNPLTARVLANRIWLKLTGEGLVRTPDNFGTTGEAPTHPDLLDYLAERLVSSGWSAKALVREIMLSRVYSRSTEASPSATDPENRLYSRAHRRSLDVETMRDTILTLADTLDGEAGGPSLPPNFRSEFGYEFTTLRRSVYVPVFRNSGFEMFTTFDFANPNFTVGKRSRSTIPTQALFLTNSEFIHRHAGEAASALLQLPAASDDARVELAFRRTLGRKPSREERALALEFLRESGDSETADDADAWAALQRALFASIDFRFVR
ncbi:MAG: DUF1553 domain-containing protein [Verrucomicrobiales bacterium]